MKRTAVSMLAAAFLLIGLLSFCAVPAALAEHQPKPAAQAPLTGGWTVNREDTAMEANPEAQAALDKALEGLVGASYEPVACLGKQVVAGTNYCLLCRITPVVPNAVPHFALVYVYQALDGSAELLQVQDLTLGVLPEE